MGEAFVMASLDCSGRGACSSIEAEGASLNFTLSPPTRLTESIPTMRPDLLIFDYLSGV